MRGHSPTLLSPGFQCREEEFPPNLTVEISATQVRRKKPENSDASLKGLCTETHPGLQWRVSSLEGVQETYKEKQFCGTRARAGGTAPLYLCQSLLWGRLQMGTIVPMLNCLPRHTQFQSCIGPETLALHTQPKNHLRGPVVRQPPVPAPFWPHIPHRHQTG